MDVGLNNKNLFTEKQLSRVDFLVEANSNEQHDLWCKWSTEYRKHFCKHEIVRIPTEAIELDDVVLQFLSDLAARNEIFEKSHRNRVDWVQDNCGFAFSVGKYCKKEIWVSFSFATIKGKYVCFYDATSNVVNHQVVKDYLIRHFQRTHDNYTSWNHVDAQNFHNCIHSLDKLDTEPRETVYQKD